MPKSMRLNIEVRTLVEILFKGFTQRQIAKKLKFLDIACNNRFKGCYKLVQARGVMVIVVGNGHGDTSSNPGRY